MESSPNQSSSIVPKVVGGIVAVLLCCACAVIVAAGVILYQASQQVPINDTFPTFEPTIEFFTEESPNVPTPSLTLEPEEPISSETLETLNQTLVPENDPYDLSCRLNGICDVPRTVPGKVYQVGDREQFWVSNNDMAEHRQMTATLLYITPHSYFWAEEGVFVDIDAMKRLMDTFEENIYPTNRAFFGSESNPGVDNDPHVFIIYASDIGSSIAGYFNSSDSYNPLVKEYSNAHETFIMGSDQNLSREYTYSTLAHEFVHMIQNAYDRNDVSWLGEGFAELGVFLNNYYVGGKDRFYLQNPDLQLNTWVDSSSTDFRAHYGQSFLYLTYFLDRFGEDATKALTTNPENSITSVDDTLAQLGITDPLTGQVITADDVFVDWAVTLYLMDGSVGDGRYNYYKYPDAPQVTSGVEFASGCPLSLNGTVNQYGMDYINISCDGDYTLHFSGATAIRLLPTEMHSGKYAFWSNKGDESDMTLTREFDFTSVSSPIEISYWTWYDIEENWDYLFVEASTDGENWEILKTPSGTDYDPSGNSYGWGYTGTTGDWIEETVDLSQFAGQKIFIRFEYITDAAVNGEGLLLDDVRVDAAGYSSDFEADDGGWVAEGFARIENVLPQTYRLSLILKGDTTTVTPITLNADNTVDIPLSLQSGNEAILVVAGTTRFTTVPAAYQIEVK